MCCHLHWSHCVELPSWLYQLALSWYLHQQESHQSLSETEICRLIDRTPCIAGSNRNIYIVLFVYQRLLIQILIHIDKYWYKYWYRYWYILTETFSSSPCSQARSYYWHGEKLRAGREITTSSSLLHILSSSKIFTPFASSLQMMTMISSVGLTKGVSWRKLFCANFFYEDTHTVLAERFPTKWK